MIRSLTRRLFVWLLIGLFVYVVRHVYVRPEEEAILPLIYLMSYGLVLLIYEVNVSWLFPNYLYTGRWLRMFGFSVALLVLVHELMYLGYPLLQSVAQIPESLITQFRFPRSHLLVWYRVHESGMWGWLDPYIITDLLSSPYFSASPFLLTQLVRHYARVGSSVRQTELDNLALNGENLLLELDLLKAQLNPHFLFNALNSIYVRVIDADEQAAELVLRLAELMRYNLYETEAPTVPLDQELGYIENYLQLEQARHGERVEIIFSSEGDLTHLRIAPLILLAFVENAFKHGVGGQQEAAYVWVEAHTEPENTLVFTVQNSLATSAQRHFPDRKSGGVGLPNVRQRLALLYPDRHQIDLEQSVDSYVLTLTLQLTSVPAEATPA